MMAWGLVLGICWVEGWLGRSGRCAVGTRRWVVGTGFLGEGSSDGGPRRQVLLSLLWGGDGGVFYFYKFSYFFVRV